MKPASTGRFPKQSSQAGPLPFSSRTRPLLRVAYRAEYSHPLPEGHKFPMEKYELLPQQLLYEGTLTAENFFVPEALATDDILAVHDAEYLRRLRALELTAQEMRKTGFPQSEALIRREELIMGGTVQAALYAREHGCAMNIAGGTHHAFTDRGEGFCLLNDLALAARYLVRHGLAQRPLIVDLDVHQGNGTAQIFRDDPSVFTFSMHSRANYPLHKEVSDLDVELEPATPDEVYLQLLDQALEEVVARHRPDFVLYQCGVDVLATDKLGHLALTLAGCRERDRRVLALCHQKGWPVVAAMGGGYSPRIADIVEAHANTFRLAAQLWG